MLEEKEVRQLSLTRSLNVEGWAHLDAILLAALATQAPVLLVGPHGTAKTLLVERLSDALSLAFRHYNASLLNYDDLVGIPMPEKDGKQLSFVTTPGAIWDAEFVFFDEISRCRPDLQNKLFPIIHERRVVGINLERLQYRWAAMNPPSPDAPDADTMASQYYLGSEPLDPALTDRFPFVVPVPDWQQLSQEDRRRLIGMNPDDHAEARANFAAETLPQLVAECEALIPQIEAEYGDWLTDYIICAMDLLERAKLAQSPRRARMLARSVVAIHAARIALEETSDIDMDLSAEMALVYGMPQNATEVPPAPATVVAVHKQAWEIASKLDDDAWRQVLEESDPVRRVVLAEGLDFSTEDMSRLVTQALGSDESEARLRGLAVAIFMAFRRQQRLNPAAYEPLMNLAYPVLQPSVGSLAVTANSQDMTTWNEIKSWLLKRRTQGDLALLEVNYVLSGFPEMWREYNWRDSLNQFVEDLKMFGVKEVS